MFNNRQIERIRILHNQGYSNRAIAKKMRCSHPTIAKYLRDLRNKELHLEEPPVLLGNKAPIPKQNTHRTRERDPSISSGESVKTEPAPHYDSIEDEMIADHNMIGLGIVTLAKGVISLFNGKAKDTGGKETQETTSANPTSPPNAPLSLDAHGRPRSDVLKTVQETKSIADRPICHDPNSPYYGMSADEFQQAVINYNTSHR